MIDEKQTSRVKKNFNCASIIYDMFEWLPEGRSLNWRERVWFHVPTGKVLEVGIGTGRNLPYHPDRIRVIGMDLSDGMLAKAHNYANRLNYHIDLQQMDVQQLAFADDTFETVVATFVFCSVPNQIHGLQELKRVVKQDGRIILLDHVRINKPIIGWLMDMLNVFTHLFGENINRRTVENVKQAGLKIESVTDLTRLGLVKLIVATKHDQAV
ncbi:MAG: hypothetical protein B6242_00325 [Anaerolineaceae bacterium 4572_78]|nr:MAG: hypothetical protein B6242_00325 [Anaerolineaceae bacterium 4572_78]